MKSSKGNAVANQIIVNTEYYDIFQSYGTVIMKIVHESRDRDAIFLDSRYWNYSKTTSKYRNEFLGMTTKEIEAKINTGEIHLTDLN